MILHRLTFSNFLVYAGEQCVDLAPPTAADGRGVSVVVAPNNSGKTSILRALRFWFYGREGIGGSGDQIPHLVNNQLRDSTAVGAAACAWVEVDFEVETGQGSVRVSLRRTLEIKRRGESKWDVMNLALQRVIHSPRFKLEDDTGDKWQRQLNAIMPPQLFGAFFFMGEPLDGELLENVGKIRAALGQFLHEDQWREAEQAALQVRDRLGRTLQKLSESDTQLRSKQNALDNNQRALDDQQAALDVELAELAAVEQRMREDEKRAGELGDAEAADHMKGALNRSIQHRDTATRDLHQTDDEILHQIRQASGLPFLARAIEPVSGILRKMQQDNILPADISPGFVDRVVQADCCLCGRAHTKSTRSAWETYKQKTLEANVSDGLRKLLDWVVGDGPLSVAGRCRSVDASLEQLLERRQHLVQARNQAETERREAENQLAELPHEELQQIARSLRDGRAKQSQLESRIRTLTHKVQTSEKTVALFRREIQEIRRKSKVDMSQFDQVTASYERAGKLAKALKACRERLTPYFRAQLQAAVTRSYDRVATDGSRAHIDAGSLLPSIHVNGQATRNLGGGQSQLLALSYVVALARLRQNMHRQLRQLKVTLGRGGEMPFFMDSPLGKMEDHYKRAALAEILHSSRQLVILLWKQEWEFARPTLEPLAGSIYGIELRAQKSDLANLTAADRRYDFEAGRRELVKEAATAEDRGSSLIAVA